ncbi:hypothetical protein E2320_014479, partial [Naja naja]
LYKEGTLAPRKQRIHYSSGTATIDILPEGERWNWKQ